MRLAKSYELPAGACTQRGAYAGEGFQTNGQTSLKPAESVFIDLSESRHLAHRETLSLPLQRNPIAHRGPIDLGQSSYILNLLSANALKETANRDALSHNPPLMKPTTCLSPAISYLPLSVALVLSASQASASTLDAKVDSYLRNQMRSNHIPGLALAVVREGKLIKLQSYGSANLETNSPVTPDSAFQLASTTKIFTGAILMLLVDQGKLSLNAPVTKYLPELPDAWSRVTIRHLATHSSGVPNISGPDPVPGVTEVDVVKEVAKLQLTHAPGEKSGYDSADFVLLSEVIKRVSGKPLATFLDRQIFAPLGMTGTQFDGAVQMGLVRRSRLVAHRTAVYQWRDGQQMPFSFLFPVHAYGAGGLYSTSRDLAKWAVALDQGKVLKATSLREMWAPHRLSSGEQTSWGVGWVVRTYEGRRTVGHSGGPALSDFLRLPDQKLTVIVLQNQQKMYPYLAQGVADFYLPPSPVRRKAIVPDPNPRVSKSLRSLVGGLAGNKLDIGCFAKGQEELIDDTRNLLVPYVRSLAAIEDFRLVESSPISEGHHYVYAATYGKKVVEWTFDLDDNAKIIGLNVQTP